jgi:hypothetical protein
MNRTACAVYQIRVQGRLEGDWSEWFSGFEVAVEGDTTEGAVTTLTGHTPDQAALRGILNRMWDLNLVVISVVRLETAPDDEP